MEDIKEPSVDEEQYSTPATMALEFRGVTDEYPAEWAFRMARLLMIPAGTNEIMRFIVQREIYKERKQERKRKTKT